MWTKCFSFDSVFVNLWHGVGTELHHNLRKLCTVLTSSLQWVPGLWLPWVCQTHPAGKHMDVNLWSQVWVMLEAESMWQWQDSRSTKIHSGRDDHLGLSGNVSDSCFCESWQRCDLLWNPLLVDSSCLILSPDQCLRVCMMPQGMTSQGQPVMHLPFTQTHTHTHTVFIFTLISVVYDKHPPPKKKKGQQICYSLSSFEFICTLSQALTWSPRNPLLFFSCSFVPYHLFPSFLFLCSYSSTPVHTGVGAVFTWPAE